MFLFEQFYEQQIVPPQKMVQVVNKQNLPPEGASNEEEYTDNDIDSEDETGETGEGLDNLPPDLAPLKRYYLISKLKELDDQLANYNIKNDELDIIIKFVNNLSYSSLLLLSNVAIQNIEDQIARLSNEKQQ